MIKSLVYLFAIFGLAASSSEIRHLELNGAHLVDTSQGNYALTAPTLAQNNGWKTVSVNGDNAVILTQNCQSTIKSLQSVSEPEKKLLGNLRNTLNGIETNNFQTNSIYSSSRYSLDGASINRMNNNGRNSNSILQSNGLSINKIDDNNFSVTKPGLPNNLARIFVIGDVITYVFLDGQVQMKPISCLQPAEQQLLQQIRLEIQQAEEQFRQNMLNMQQNMQQSMQNMQQNMNNIFGNGFPFNHGTRNNGNMQQQQSIYGNQFPNQYQQQATIGGQNGALANSFVNPFANSNPFGNNFPFGPNNSPFTAGFPFSG